jgi:hypothetical protein
MTPSPAMLSAMREHIETLAHADRAKLDRQLAAAWLAADRVRQDETLAAVLRNHGVIRDTEAE